MWDDVVACYQLMDKPHKAEMVVRERIAAAGESPYMLTALGDLTQVQLSPSVPDRRVSGNGVVETRVL